MYGQFYCTMCLIRGRLVKAEHRHHIIYPDDVTVPLCRQCHVSITAMNTLTARMLRHSLDAKMRSWVFYMCLRSIAKEGFDEMEGKPLRTPEESFRDMKECLYNIPTVDKGKVDRYLEWVKRQVPECAERANQRLQF